MKVLSLFDGMACGMLAMQKAGVEVDRYVAYEIDKYAVQTSTHNFPMIEQRGDVFQADFSEFSDFDFLVGGSPCTYWSIAHKNNRETEASGLGWELFCQYVRALHEAKPKFFIYENNKSMSKAIRASIDEAFGFEAVCINSALVSAQNRQRLYWVGKRNDDGTYSKVNVEQPEDRGILLKHILERGYDLTGNDKSYCLTASYDGACAWNTIERSQRSMVAEPVRIPEYGNDEKSRPVTACYAYKGCGEGSLATEAFPDNPNKQVRDYVAEPVPINTTVDGDKARTLMAGYYKYGTETLLTNPGFTGGTTAVADPVCVAERGRYTEDGAIEQRFEAREDGKTNVLTTVQKDNNVAEPVRVGTWPNNAKNQTHDSQQYRIYNTDGKSVTLCGNGGGMGAKTGLYAIPCCNMIVREATNCQHYQYCGVLSYATPCEWDEGGRVLKAISCADGKTYDVYEVKEGKITIKGKQYPIKLVDGCYIIRKLTVRECMRLQTVPEWYEFPVSDSQAYKMLGNGWTVDVIVHLITSALGDK